ncbi:hypothetical protein [Pectinatus frisingensis]|uniref:hypothetical protein n=1 Tax=Pectinatus frisingensis TaxID=865 RepID=UPI0018C7C2CD|nr:hypothetical protein [Pectinatus frisingensis]
MFGQTYGGQQQYGPMNALADILGAYWTKKNTEGAMDYASNFNPIQDSSQQQQPNQSIIQAAQNYGQNATNPLDKAIAQGVNGNTTAPMGQITGTPNGLNGSILQAAQNYVQGTGASASLVDAFSNGINQQQSQYDQQQAVTQKAALQKQYDDFAAAKAANPEWYVGDTYVGSDQNAKQAAIQKQQQQQIDTANQAFQDRRNTYNQYKSQVVAMKAKAMKDLISKYGVSAAKQVEPMIDSAIQSRMSNMADQIDEQNRQWLAPYIMGDQVNTPQGLQRALWATQEYNNTAKQMGLAGVDIPTVGKMLDAGNVAITSKDLGNGVAFYAVPKTGGTFDDGSYIKPILSAAKGVSPDTAAGLTEKHFEWENASGNAKLQSSTQLQTTQMNNSSRERISSAQLSAKQGNSQGLSQKISALKAILADPTTDDNTRQQAQSQLSAISGIGGNGSGGDAVGNWIDKAYENGYSKAQIQQALRDKGYGDSYDSWLWD